MVRAASAEKTPDERIMLQLAKMKESFAAKHPSDDEVEQDPVNGKQGVAGLDAGKTLESFRKFDLFKVR